MANVWALVSLRLPPHSLADDPRVATITSSRVSALIDLKLVAVCRVLKLNANVLGASV